MIDVGAVAEFAEGTVTVRRAGTQEIGVIRWADTLYAVRNVCPHQLAPICRGSLRPLLTVARPGAIAPACDGGRPVLTCPWHGWEFDIGDGRAVWSDRMRLRTYAVELRAGRVLVDVRRHGDGHGAVVAASDVGVSDGGTSDGGATDGGASDSPARTAAAPGR